MNNGNPIWDYIDHLSGLTLKEETRVAVPHYCNFCNQTFYTEQGLELECGTACQECVDDGTVKKELAECGMGPALIERMFIHAVKIEH